jgi:hypothetical protein
MTVLVGCDPELFLRHRETKLFHSAHGMIPGTKHEPFKVDKGAYQVDGMGLEFNIDPASSAEEFESNIKTVLEQLRAAVPEEFEFVLQPTATFTKDHFDLQPDEAKELGCEPDFNAYTGRENPRPDNKTTMRTASGHVHLGVRDTSDPHSPEHMIMCQTLVKQLDLWLGVPSLLYDSDAKRRTMYGQAGAFRPKPYGVEYRTLSNQWLSSPELIRWVFNQCQRAVENLIEIKGMIKTEKAAPYYIRGALGSSINQENLEHNNSSFRGNIYHIPNLRTILEGFPK